MSDGKADHQAGEGLAEDEARALASVSDTRALMGRAAALRDAAFGPLVTHSRKVFLPLTRLCRDVCHYCTFATTPRHVDAPYLSVEQAVALARRGADMGCREALFTLGERPELRYRAARDALARLGAESTLAYVARAARAVFDETGLLPHVNAGCMDDDEIAMLRPVCASMGVMLESASERLTRPGMPHYGSPDKAPRARLATVEAAGRARVPLTSGILVGIGETRSERVESLLALRCAHRRHGHLQEVIVQNFRAKPGTRMADAPEPALDELLWTVAVARLIFAGEVSVQAPPNLSPGALANLVAAGIDDWGGISPLTPDFVNPEAPWPHLRALARETRGADKRLVQRLTVYPRYVREVERWLDPYLVPGVLRQVDGQGMPREDPWQAGSSKVLPAAAGTSAVSRRVPARDALSGMLDRARRGECLSEGEIERLFGARGDEFTRVCRAADALRQEVAGTTVRYVVNRNINYTNMCRFRCRFCAFSKGRTDADLRGRPYDLDHDEIARRALEAWDRGATEVCLQGGIHPDYTGAHYLEVCRVIKAATPRMHIHAFSPLEVWHGAATLGLSPFDFLLRLRRAGLATLPGTAAEILDDEVRAVLCPDKIGTRRWLEVIESAHAAGLGTTATIMFGHVDRYEHWARHLLRIRALQERTGGFREFVPLPFVAAEAPLYRRGRARPGPTFREAVLMHAIARLSLHPAIPNIQTSWVKMGRSGAQACLRAGASDMGGTLMNESITRAAGASHGEELPPAEMEALIAATGRVPAQRTTAYGPVPAERRRASFRAGALAPRVDTPPVRRNGDAGGRACGSVGSMPDRRALAGNDARGVDE